MDPARADPGRSAQRYALSRDRFFAFTSWPTDLRGERVLEAGSGSGRFTQVLLDAGADVVSFDYSAAVGANLENNGGHPRRTLFRGDIFHLPFPPGSFDGVVCLGVLQHTPDPRRAFLSLASRVAPGGRFAADISRLAPVSVLHPKYLLRPVRWFVPQERLFAWCQRATPRLLPIKAALRQIPVVGVPLAHVFVPVPDYRGRLPLSTEQAMAWSQLDLFDWIAPAHDHPVTRRRLEAWCCEAGLEDIHIEVVSKGWQFTIQARCGKGRQETGSQRHRGWRALRTSAPAPP